MTTKYRAVIIKSQSQYVEFETADDLSDAEIKIKWANRLWDETKPSNGLDVEHYVEWIQVIPN
jgi:hypothetical protein